MKDCADAVLAPPEYDAGNSVAGCFCDVDGNGGRVHSNGGSVEVGEFKAEMSMVSSHCSGVNRGGRIQS